MVTAPAQSSTAAMDAVMKAQLWTDRGAYENLSYMPVFRASGLFFVRVNADCNTRVGFLNYWREKNEIAHIGMLASIRDEGGVLIRRLYEPVTRMSYDLNLRDLLSNQLTEPGEFVGSIEVELFSAQDLKFQFPALTVFYETPEGTSYVHANQRTYNSAEDRARSGTMNAWQTGFDVDPRLDPFIWVVNGPHAVAESQADLIWLGADGQEQRTSIGLGSLAPYEVRDLRLKQVPELTVTLAAARDAGTCKIDIQLPDTHQRFCVGNALPDASWASVTHSFFDNVALADYIDSATLEPNTYPAFIPVALVDGLDTDVVLYPIYSPCNMRLSLQAFDEAGRERLWLDLGHYQSPSSGIKRFDVRQTLRTAGQQDTAGLYVFHFQAEPGDATARLPARITYGLNYHLPGRLGTNISSSVYSSKFWGVRPRSWRWGPLVMLSGAQNKVLVSVFDKHCEATSDAPPIELTLRILNNEGEVTRTALATQRNSAVVVEIELLLQTARYAVTPGETLWYALESASSSLDAVQLTISANGWVAGDHCY